MLLEFFIFYKFSAGTALVKHLDRFVVNQFFKIVCLPMLKCHENIKECVFLIAGGVFSSELGQFLARVFLVWWSDFLGGFLWERPPSSFFLILSYPSHSSLQLFKSPPPLPLFLFRLERPQNFYVASVLRNSNKLSITNSKFPNDCKILLGIFLSSYWKLGNTDLWVTLIEGCENEILRLFSTCFPVKPRILIFVDTPTLKNVFLFTLGYNHGNWLTFDVQKVDNGNMCCVENKMHVNTIFALFHCCKINLSC